MEGDQEQTAQIIEWHPRPTEIINNVEMNLGTIGLAKLISLEDWCQERIDRAGADMSTVHKYVEHLFPTPDSPDGAA